MSCERCAQLEAELLQTKADLAFVQEKSKDMIEELRVKLAKYRGMEWRVKKKKDQGKLFNLTGAINER